MYISMIKNNSEYGFQENLIRETMKGLGSVAKYARISKPKYCEECGKNFDNLLWHKKLFHDKWNAEKFHNTITESR